MRHIPGPTFDSASLADVIDDAYGLTNTKVAYAGLTTGAIRERLRLLGLAEKNWLTRLIPYLGSAATSFRLPGRGGVIRDTVLEQYTGGRSLFSIRPVVAALAGRKVGAVLHATGTGDPNATLRENLAALDFCDRQGDPKPSLIVRVEQLIPVTTLRRYEGRELDFVRLGSRALREGFRRLDALCSRARAQNLYLIIEAGRPDVRHVVYQLSEFMMHRYNRGAVTVVTSLQWDGEDQTQRLARCLDVAAIEGYLPALKLGGVGTVGNPSLLAAVKCCAQAAPKGRYWLATHDEALIRQVIGLRVPNLTFLQRYGIGDHLTFNLATQPFNAAKFVPYGNEEAVLLALARRADRLARRGRLVQRERQLLRAELARRG